jgi:cobalt-precorrin 5A hydrolase/precorrin-3B C17-methyltransferase
MSETDTAPRRVIALAATATGWRQATHLGAALPEVELGNSDGSLADAVAEAWRAGDALVLFAAVGIATRLIAPHLADKHTDPAVVAVDDAGGHAVALVGGHRGGNALTHWVAGALGAQPVITTATEATGAPALEQLGARLGLCLDDSASDLAAVAAALLAGDDVALWRRRPWPTGPLPPNVVEVAELEPAAQRPTIVVSDELGDRAGPTAAYRPPSLVVGVGAASGVAADEVELLVSQTLAGVGLAEQSVAALATVEAKAHEPGIAAVAERRGWRLLTYPPEVLAGIDTPNPSEAVRDAVGTPSVAEAAAAAGGELVSSKHKSANATAAIARRPASGRLTLISAGPGAAGLVPEAAREAVADAELLIGLESYIETVRAWTRPGCEIAAMPIGDELARAEAAVSAAVAGRSVALVSGGDVGVYAMGAPALERAPAELDVRIVPGVTAANAAAAAVGAPLGHDHCAVSLSDLLTPWEAIEARVRAAAEADLVVAFYNPASRKRTWQLGRACALLAAHRPANTPVAVVADATRQGQQALLTRLEELDTSSVGMHTTVIVGSSQTRLVGGRMVTPRGYEGHESVSVAQARAEPAAHDADGPRLEVASGWR